MNWYIFLLGVFICGLTGIVDQNLLMNRFIAVITLQSFGVVILLYGLGVLNL